MSDVTTGNPSLKYFCPPCITKVNPTTRRRIRSPYRSKLRKDTGSSPLERHGRILGTRLGPPHTKHSHHAVIGRFFHWRASPGRWDFPRTRDQAEPLCHKLR